MGLEYPSKIRILTIFHHFWGVSLQFSQKQITPGEKWKGFGIDGQTLIVRIHKSKGKRNLVSTMRCGNPQEIAKSEWIEEMDLIRERTKNS